MSDGSNYLDEPLLNLLMGEEVKADMAETFYMRACAHTRGR